MSWIRPNKANEALERVAAAFMDFIRAWKDFSDNPLPTYTPPRQRYGGWRRRNRRKWNRREKR